MKMLWYQLSPDCIGLDSRLTTSRFGVPILHVIAELPADSDLLCTIDCYLATPPLISAIRSSRLSGVAFEECIITLDDQFTDVYPDDYPISELQRLIVSGTPQLDDFALDQRGRLVVSEGVIQLLNLLNYNHCDSIVLSGGEQAEALLFHRRKSYK